MIEKAVETWLQFITGERLKALDALSWRTALSSTRLSSTPPQRGKDVTTRYLRSAAAFTSSVIGRSGMAGNSRSGAGEYHRSVCS